MFHCLDVPKATFQRAGGSKRTSFPQCCKRAPLPVPRCSSRGSLQATSPLFASASGSDRQRIFATLHSQCRRTVSGLNARPLPLFPTGFVPVSVLSKGRSIPPESWSRRVWSPHQELSAQPPALASVCQSQQRPQAGVDTVDPDSGTPARMPAPSETSSIWVRKRRSPICHCCPCLASPSRPRCQLLRSLLWENRPSPSPARLRNVGHIHQGGR